MEFMLEKAESLKLRGNYKYSRVIASPSASSLLTSSCRGQDLNHDFVADVRAVLAFFAVTRLMRDKLNF